MPEDPENDGPLGDLPLSNIADRFHGLDQSKGIHGWLAYIGKLAYNVAQLPRILFGLAEVGVVIITFILFNLDNFRPFVARLPRMLSDFFGLLQNLINIGPAIMSWSLPGWAIAQLQFLNSVLPLTEVFQVISGLVALYTVALFVRVLLKLTIVFR